MRKQIVLLIVSLLLLMGVAVGSSFWLAQTWRANESAKEKNATRTFAEWTEEEIFQSIPAMIVTGTQIGKVSDCGAGNYIIGINGTTVENYEDYLVLLKKEGYKFHIDNGEGGIDSSVYTTHFTKDELGVTVTHLVKADKTYVIAGENQNWSQYLKPDKADATSVTEDAKTSLHMIELYDYGNSFLFQLKNGHFIVNDGGMEEDLIYLIEYLEELTPGDEKPIIDAWIISHAHGDHMGVFKELVEYHPEYAERICVEELLFNQPNSDVISTYGHVADVTPVVEATTVLKNSKGEATPLIRPMMGQKYYFCDIEMEVVFSQEFLTFDNYSEDINDSSTWLMYNIEGQKALLGGDGDWGGIKAIMRSYESDYFQLDVFTNLHHAINVFDVFTDFCDIKTVLVPFYDDMGYWPITVANGTRLLAQERVLANQHLIASVDEIMTGADGTLVLEFPYVVGTAKRLAHNDWLHHPGERRNSVFKEVQTKK